MHVLDNGWLEFDVPHGVEPTQTALKILGERNGLWHGPREVLTTRAIHEARPNSLSRIHGLDEQPPHTDGAHEAKPPAFILLWADQAADGHAYTHLRMFDPSKLSADFSDQFSRAVWSVRVSSSKFFYRRAFHPDTRTIRWDSGCFVRCTSTSLTPAIVDHALKELPEVRITWAASKALLIDNRRVLHGRSRADTAVNSSRRIKRVLFYDN